MGSEVVIYRCRACGREMGFVEHFSHDHPDFLNDRPTVELKLCPECRAAKATTDERDAGSETRH